jgi:serine/threonine protein kinase
MGTPSYMAPEQIEGGGDVSERTDIYALGVVLYEMLTGGAPFRASTPGTVLVKQLREMPVPIRKLRGEVPAAVERVVMQALEKKPQRRQRDMDEVVQGLRKTGGTLGEGEIPRSVSEPQPLSQRIADRLQVVKYRLPGAGVTISIGVVLGIGLILWFGGFIGKGDEVLQTSPQNTLQQGPEPKIRLHISQAESFRDRGEFTQALAELEKARAIDPTDMGVQAEIERTKRACLAEKKLGLTEARCD